MSSPSTCPNDNSTEAILCLLRLITDNTQPGWDWDPLNFAVTLAIGILALIIAAITVGQGLLAAGPGRLKASNLAIGPFSIHSRSRFDRTELALRTTARVPLITWDVVYHRVVRQKFRPNFDLPSGRLHQLSGDSEAGAQTVDEFDKGSKTFSTTTIKQRHQYDSTATWLTLLTTLGLDDPQFFPLVQRVTDYLPADVQAAPAAAELRCLAILAVIADTGATIERAANRFIRVTADSSQLVFRDHPVMGAVAAYEAYEATAMLKVGDSPPLQFGTHLQTMKFEDLDRCLQLASGRLAYADGRIPPSLDGVVDERTFLLLVNDLKKRSGTCGHDICTHAYDDWTSGLTGVRENRQPWHYIDAMRTLYMATSLLAADRANMCRGFPKKAMRLAEGLQAIVKLNQCWSTEWTQSKMLQFSKLVCLTFWNQGNVKYKDALSASWVVEFTDMRSTVPNPFSPSMKRIQKQHFKQDKTIFFLKKVRAFLTRQLEPSDVQTEGYEEHKLSSVALAQLLACVDEWLLRKGGAAAACTMLKLLYKLGSQSGLLTVVREDHPSDGFLPEMLSPKLYVEHLGNGALENLSVDEKVQVQLDSECVEALDMSTMIILRGILMAILLDDGADTSILYQSDFRNSIVRVL